MAEQTQTYQIQLRSQSKQNQEQTLKTQKQTKTKKTKIKNKKIEKNSKTDSNPLNFGNISTIDIQSHASCFQDIQNLKTNLSDNNIKDQDELLNIAFINQSQFSNLTETSNNEFSLQDFNQNLASFLQKQNYEYYKDKIEQSLQNLEFRNYLQTRKRDEFYDDVGNQIKKCLKIKN